MMSCSKCLSRERTLSMPESADNHMQKLIDRNIESVDMPTEVVLCTNCIVTFLQII